MTDHEKWLLQQAFDDDPTYRTLYDWFISQNEFTVQMGDVEKRVVVQSFTITDAPAPDLYTIETALRIIG